MTKSRDEHLAWCKKHAIAYLDQHDVHSAICSMMSGLQEHPETPMPQAIAALGLRIAMDQDEIEARRWIEGFR